jgi:nucleoid DNA-binding protein
MPGGVWSLRGCPEASHARTLAPLSSKDCILREARRIDNVGKGFYASLDQRQSTGGGKTLIKQDIIHQVIERTGLQRNKAEAAVDTVFETLKRALAEGQRIELRGFGVFNVRPRKTGIGRNPRTGAEVSITPGKAVRFKPGKELHLLDN